MKCYSLRGLMLLLSIVLCGGAATAQTTIHELKLEQNKSKAIEGKAYLFAVPYTVPVANIVASNNSTVNASQGSVAIYVYEGARQANGQDPWEAVSNSSELNAGRCYKMILNGTTQNTWKCRPNANPSQQKNITISANTSSNPALSGWNGIANTSWSKATPTLNGVTYAYRYDNSNSVYILESLDRNWEVAEPMIIQAPAAGKMTFTTSGVGFDFGGNMDPGDEFDAPARNKEENSSYTLIISPLDDGFIDNANLFIQSESKDKYVIGEDLVKLHGEGTGVLQIWMEAYGTDLSVLTAATTDGKADIKLHIYAPETNDYTLSIGGDNLTRFSLTKDGATQTKTINYWRIHLNKGDNIFTLHYGNQTPTALETHKSDKRYNKIMRDGQLYIEHNGQWFNLLGERMP
ncbi:MAG: hypothetical protein K5660_03925 [Paludibacteraceae bacterium]|nr:hypothetical protein [Paludibacteraceae bacterium]